MKLFPCFIVLYDLILHTISAFGVGVCLISIWYTDLTFTVSAASANRQLAAYETLTIFNIHERQADVTLTQTLFSLYAK